MTEVLSKAKNDVAKVVESRITEIMATAVQRSAKAIAEAVLADCSNPFDPATLNDAIAEQLGGWDFSGEINLASGEVSAA